MSTLKPDTEQLAQGSTPAMVSAPPNVEIPGASAWFAERIQKAVSKDAMSRSDRLSELVGLGVVLLLTLFFVFHQVAGTGFFTAAFGTLEAVLFYGVVPFSVVVSLARFLRGRRNPVRPFDVLSSGWMAATCLWLALVFPLNFAHLGDPLGPLGPLLSWVPNILAQFLFAIGGVASAGNAAYQVFLYVSVRRVFGGQVLPSTGV